MSGRAVVLAPAKINLWLRVFGRDTKGYHTIESLFQLISIADEILIERAGSGVTLLGAPAELGEARQNLVVRAAEAFARATGQRGGVRITLTKRVPWSAGLGGGSSDAAATLTALNRLSERPLPHAELVELGAALGSDVPFFLAAAALALGWGRGERLLALPPLPSRPLLVVPPAAPVRTQDAYAWVDQDRGVETTGEFAAVLPSEALASWEAVRHHSHNDFESAVTGRLPAIGHWMDRLRETDPFLVRLAGSGGAVVGLYESVKSRDAAWLRLGSDQRILKGETLTSAPVVTVEG